MCAFSHYSVNFRWLTALLLAVCVLPMNAQTGDEWAAVEDSVWVDSLCVDTAVVEDDTHELRVWQVAVPTAAVGLGAWAAESGWGRTLQRSTQKALSPRGSHHFRADEVLQFVPTAASWGLQLAGVKGQHGTVDHLWLTAMAWTLTVGLTQGLKWTFHEQRPDGADDASFPSGHTARAFCGAEMLYQEYKHVSPWIGYAGYGMAALTGYLRIYNNKHYLNDVVAGAAVGFLSARMAYWLYPKLSSRHRQKMWDGLAFVPYYDGRSGGVNFALRW